MKLLCEPTLLGLIQQSASFFECQAYCQPIAIKSGMWSVSTFRIGPVQLLDLGEVQPRVVLPAKLPEGHGPEHQCQPASDRAEVGFQHIGEDVFGRGDLAAAVSGETAQDSRPRIYLAGLL